MMYRVRFGRYGVVARLLRVAQPLRQVFDFRLVLLMAGNGEQLVYGFEQQVDVAVAELQRAVKLQKKAAKVAKKIHKGEGFTLNDFKEQMEQMANMGGMAGLMDKLPGMGQVPDAVKAQVGDKEVKKLIAIVNSMTEKERTFPAVIKGSRKKRIAAGSGTQVQDVNKLLKQFTQMQKVMKKMKGGGMAKMMRGMQGKLPGGFPGGGMPPGGGGAGGGGFPF